MSSAWSVQPVPSCWKARGGFLGPSNAGAIYVFEREGSAWVERAKLVASDGEESEMFSDRNVAIHGTTCIVGVFQDDDHGERSGSAYVYDLACLASFETYCLCASGAPCGNEDETARCVNSTGNGALLAPSPASSNSTSYDDLILPLSRVPADPFGIVYMGPNQDCAPFGDGLRAVEPGPPDVGYFRFPIHHSGPAGAWSEGPGIVAFSEAHFGPNGTTRTGETWNFQGFYRDPGGPCGAGFNLSNGLSVTFGF